MWFSGTPPWATNTCLPPTETVVVSALNGQPASEAGREVFRSLDRGAGSRAQRCRDHLCRSHRSHPHQQNLGSM